MILKCIAFLAAALMLANCCALGNGCAPPPGASIASDGLGSAPADDTEPVEAQPKAHARAKREISRGPLAAASGRNVKPQPEDSWEQQQTADQADEKRLKRILTICSTCSAGEFARPGTARNARPQPEDSWEQQQTADQADEKRLKRILTICSTCSAGESARDETT